MKKVLIISFYFPPANNPGAIRIGKFAKYLPQFGWEPIVLTVDRVKGLPQNLPLEIAETNIVRTPYFDMWPLIAQKLSSSTVTSSRTIQAVGRGKSSKKVILKILRLMRPIYTLPLIDELLWDPVGWYPYAVKKGTEILAKDNIDMILSTYNPSLPHLIASRLHQKTGIPWIAEFRDLWSLNPFARKTQPFQFSKERWEKRIMKSCDLLVTVSEPLAKDLAVFHSKKVMVIPNGFDEEDYKENVSLTSKFTITFTGKIYDPHLDPTPLVEALDELKRKGIISSDDVELRFFGKFIYDIPSRLAKKHCLEDIIKTYDFVPFKESINRQQESTVLLVSVWIDPRGEGIHSAKFFEYLGAGRPILAIAPKGGEIDKLLQESGTGIVANKANEIEEILVKWLGEFKRFGNILSYYNPNSEVIRRLSRKEGTKKLAGVLDEVVNFPRKKYQS